MAKDKNYVSVWFWLFATIVVALPCIGLVIALAFAFVGENESRKNYFKASIILQFLIYGLLFGAHALGLAAIVIKAIHDQWPQLWN